MAFKGTAERDVQRINLDAERLGAEVNAHTDKDHTALPDARAGGTRDRLRAHARRHRAALDLSRGELERERQVLLQEFTEDEDDPVSTGYKLFDRACYGLHAVAQPVIGSRRNIERFQRDELVRYVGRQYSGANLIVGAAGAIDPDEILRAAEAAFGAMPMGAPNLIAAPTYAGAVRARALAGSNQTHVVLGFPIPSLRDDDAAHLVAAAVFGEGMSSPLLARVREQRALAYHASCIADQFDMCGQLVIEASTSPEQFDEFLREVTGLLRAQAEAIDPVDLDRARNRSRCADCTTPRNRCAARDAALEVFVHGRLRAPGEALDRLHAVSADAVRTAFAHMLAAGPSQPSSAVFAAARGSGQGNPQRRSAPRLSPSR